MSCPRAACVLVLIVGLAATGCRALDNWLRGEPEAIRQYRSARRLFLDEDYQKAAVAFNAWLADYRDSDDVVRPFVLYQLAECYRHMRDYNNAAQYYTKLVQMYGASTDPSVKDLVHCAKLQLNDVSPKTKPEAAGGPPAKPDH